MKKIILLAFCLMFGAVNAQKHEDKQAYWDHIKALKVAFITQEMDMDAALAQKFWPIYNNYECQKIDLHNREHNDMDNLANLSEEQANEMMNDFLQIEKEEYTIKKQLYSNLKQILSAREIIKLQKVESDFNRKLIKEYRERKAAERKKK